MKSNGARLESKRWSVADNLVGAKKCLEFRKVLGWMLKPFLQCINLSGIGRHAQGGDNMAEIGQLRMKEFTL